ncbi:MAG: hypothetical protein WC622_00650 [Pedobacter sp.]|jgi:hypothetical protein|uniref:hypothetical protein n=1 Tax=Pedobacter sp. TaxID=1411316 RepID=UPI00356437C6
MKRVLFEILLLIVFFGFFLRFPEVRLPIVSGIIALVVWIVPVQLLLSVGIENWVNEFGGKFLALPLEERMAQIRSTFAGLSEVEAVKLRWFYLQACIFHYILMLMVALAFITVAIFFLMGGMTSDDLTTTTTGILAAILVCAAGYFLLPKLYPAIVKRNLDETYHLFQKKDWQKRLFREEVAMAEPYVPKTFYDFWLQGKNIDDKKAAFASFIETVNAQSSNGRLLTFNDVDKLEIKCVVHAKGLSKSLAGFLKYCIEERGVLSDEILRHRYRELLRDVFSLEELKNLVFLEGQRYKSTPVEYVEVYRAK